MLKSAGPWMDPYFHHLIHCILIVFYCGGRGDRTAAKYQLERSSPSGHFQRHDYFSFIEKHVWFDAGWLYKRLMCVQQSVATWDH